MFKKRFLIPTLAFLVVLFFGLFITNPFEEDQKVFFAAAYYADVSGMPFPENVIKVWELKPVGNRAFFYLVYKSAIQFSEYSDKSLFVFICLLIYGLFTLSALAVAFYYLKTYLRNKKINPYVAYLITCLSFFAVASEISMQPEHLSIIFLICALAFALSNSKILQILSGIIITFLFLIKGITGILGLIVYAALVFDFSKYKSNLVYVFLSNAVSLLSLGLIAYFYYPQIINDFILASKLQGIGRFNFDALQTFFGTNFLVAVIIGIPTLIFGFVSLANILIYLIRKNMMRETIYLIAIWVIALLVGLLQGKGYMYHFAPLIVPSVLSILIFLYKIERPNSYVRIFSSLVIVGFLGTEIFYGFKYRQINLNQFRSEDKIYTEIDQKYSISSSPNALFLTDGTANFYFSVKSFDKYFYPLPLDRESNAFPKDAVYNETVNHLLSYHGKFLISYPQWIDLDRFTELKRKVQNEYELVYTSPVGSRTVNIYVAKDYEEQR